MGGTNRYRVRIRGPFRPFVGMDEDELFRTLMGQMDEVREEEWELTDEQAARFVRDDGYAYAMTVFRQGEPELYLTQKEVWEDPERFADIQNDTALSPEEKIEEIDRLIIERRRSSSQTAAPTDEAEEPASTEPWSGYSWTVRTHPLLAFLRTTATAVLAVVVAAVALLSLLGGTIVVIWLAVLRDWAAIGLGIAAGILMPWGYTLVTLPAMGLGLVAFALARSRGRLAAIPFGFLTSLYNNAVIAAWVIAVFAFATARAEGRPSIPYLLWAYTTTMAPLGYMAKHEPPESMATSMALFFAVISYVVCLLWFFFGTTFLPWLYAIVAIGAGFSGLAAALMLSDMIGQRQTPERWRS